MYVGFRPPRELARSTDPATSKAAAARAQRKSMLDSLLAAFCVHGQMTAEEAAHACGYTAEDGAWKRVSDLLAVGMLEVVVLPGGQEKTRSGSSGRAQRVLQATKAGRLEHEYNVREAS